MTADAMPAKDHPTGAARADEQLSAWLDGEVDGAQSEGVVRELLVRTDSWRRYVEWCAVGDALRSHEVMSEHSPRLCARIAQALQSEPALLAPRAVPRHFKRHLASGVAIAAAAAVLVLVAVPQLRSDGRAVSGALARVDASVPTDALPASRVAATQEPARAAHNPRLDPYLQAHREISDPGVMPAAAVYLRYGTEGDR